MAFQPVPTYQDPVEVDEKTGKSSFSPTWLSWFLTLSQGGLSTTIQHNSTLGLQGGVSGQYYHLSSAQLSAVNFRSTGLPVSIPTAGSPFTYQNSTGFDQSVIVQGGSVTLIEFSRNNSTYYPLGVTAGMFYLSKGDYLRVTYALSPTMTGVPR